MKIGIDARCYGITNGWGTYVTELLSKIIENDKVNAYSLFLRGSHIKNDTELPNQANVISAPNVLWKHFFLPLQINKAEFDLFFHPDQTVPLLKSRCRHIVTIHDATFMRTQSRTSFGKKLLIKKLRMITSRADGIIYISNQTKYDVEEFFPQAKNKLSRVIYHGIDRRLFNPNKSSNKKPSHGLPDIMSDSPYLLYYGGYRPHKNVYRLLEAFKSVQDDPKLKDYKFIMVGAKKSADKLLIQYESNGKILFTNPLRTEDLACLIKYSDGVLYPSLYEGFGFPVLEGMACGVPVLSSNTGAIPEIMDGAGLLVNPYDVKAIADGIIQLVSDQSTRSALIEKGLTRVQQFTWDATAKATIEFINYFQGKNEKPLI